MNHLKGGKQMNFLYYEGDMVAQRVHLYDPLHLYGDDAIVEYLRNCFYQELRVIQQELEKDVGTEYRELQFNDYNLLYWNEDAVHVRIWYWNYEEPHVGTMALDSFYEEIVRYNFEYDLILIGKPAWEVSTRAKKIIEPVICSRKGIQVPEHWLVKE